MVETLNKGSVNFNPFSSVHKVTNYTITLFIYIHFLKSIMDLSHYELLKVDNNDNNIHTYTRKQQQQQQQLSKITGPIG